MFVPAWQLAAMLPPLTPAHTTAAATASLTPAAVPLLLFLHQPPCCCSCCPCALLQAKASLAYCAAFEAEAEEDEYDLLAAAEGRRDGEDGHPSRGMQVGGILRDTGTFHCSKGTGDRGQSRACLLHDVAAAKVQRMGRTGSQQHAGGRGVSR